MLACRRTRAESLTELLKVCQPRKAEETDYVCSRVTHLSRLQDYTSVLPAQAEGNSVQQIHWHLKSMQFATSRKCYRACACCLDPRCSSQMRGFLGPDGQQLKGSLRPKANQSLGGQEGTRLRRTFGKGKLQLLNRKLRLEVQPTHFCRLLQVPYCAQSGTTYEPGQLCWQRKGSI